MKQYRPIYCTSPELKKAILSPLPPLITLHIDIKRVIFRDSPVWAIVSWEQIVVLLAVLAVTPS